MQVWGTWGALWSFADPVQFDGVAKTITVNPEISEITTVEIYSSWVRWVSLYDHLKYQQAMRTVGGDALPGGQYSGVFLFLQNGWKIIIDHAVNIDGILYTDDGSSPYIVLGGGGVVNKVAALAYAYNTAGVTVPTVNEIWNHSQRTLTTEMPNVPTAQEVSNAVWNAPVSGITDKTTIGGYLAKAVLSIPKFLGLK